MDAVLSTKTTKIFLSLKFHECDFSIKASWSVFATSRDKSTCDVINGMVKQKLIRESSMRSIENQLLSVE